MVLECGGAGVGAEVLGEWRGDTATLKPSLLFFATVGGGTVKLGSYHPWGLRVTWLPGPHEPLGRRSQRQDEK